MGYGPQAMMDGNRDRVRFESDDRKLPLGQIEEEKHFKESSSESSPEDSSLKEDSDIASDDDVANDDGGSRAEVEDCDELDNVQTVKVPTISETKSNFSKLKVPGRL